MKELFALSVITFAFTAGIVFADTFGTGGNQFTIDFVNITGDASSANGTNISQYSFGPDHKTFTDPSDFRIGTFEVTNAQWNKFRNEYGMVYGNPSPADETLNAYDENPYWTGINVPTNEVSWYEASQFVNWLNTSKGYQAAYKFTGTQGTGDYTLGVWDAADAWGGTNLYRHKDAFYFLPTEDEWVKAAYWNGTTLQTWATVGDVTPTQNGWNFYDNGYATDPQGPWDVGSGSQELNGTFDMMGNVWEWMEGPSSFGDYLPGSDRCVRGGSHFVDNPALSSTIRGSSTPYYENFNFGFRVASIPEPATLILLGMGGLIIRKRSCL